MAIIKVKTGGITADAITSTEIADNAVVTAAINADAVTDAKIADDVVGTEHLTANEVDTTALGADAVTGAQLADDAVNSEHYTDGSIDTAHIADSNVTQAKIADQAINEAKLQISNSPTNGYYLSAQSGNTGGLTWAEVAAGGITGADFWRLNTDVTFGSGTQVLDSNWERVDTDNYGTIGSAMTESSGIFTFPTTGIWQILLQVAVIRGSNERLRTTYFRIQETSNNSSYSAASSTSMSHPQNDNAGNSGSCSFIFDVTNTSNDKIRIEQYEVDGSQSNISVLGSTGYTITGISFIRLADT